jgi:hypothetical protein
MEKTEEQELELEALEFEENHLEDFLWEAEQEKNLTQFED